MKNKRDIFKQIIVIATIFIVAVIITVLNIKMIFNVANRQTDELGSLQMESIRGQLQQTLDDAKLQTLDVANEIDVLMAKEATKADIDEYLTNFFVNVFEYKAYKAQLDIVLDMYKMIARNSGQNVIRNVNSTQDSVADSVVSILRVAKLIVEGGK